MSARLTAGVFLFAAPPPQTAAPKEKEEKSSLLGGLRGSLNREPREDPAGDAPPQDAAKEKTSRFGIKGKGLFKGKGKASPEKQKQKEAPPTASGNAVDL